MDIGRESINIGLGAQNAIQSRRRCRGCGNGAVEKKRQFEPDVSLRTEIFPCWQGRPVALNIDSSRWPAETALPPPTWVRDRRDLTLTISCQLRITSGEARPGGAYSSVASPL